MGDRTGSLSLDVHTAGSDVWVRDDADGWLKATVVTVLGSEVQVKTERGDTKSVPVSECPLQNNDARGGVEARAPLLRTSIITYFVTCGIVWERLTAGRQYWEGPACTRG